MLVGHITNLLEQIAPTPLQESYDNCGLQIGSLSDECTGVLLTVDVTPDVVREAAEHHCNLIVSHHPLLFHGLKRITGATPVEQAVILAIKHGISIYACHTCLDNAPCGVSHKMAEMLGLTNVEPLVPVEDKQLKLTVFVPTEATDEVRLALFDAGASGVGQYDSCSYATEGYGSFRALEGAHPYVGELGELHFEKEHRLEVLVPTWRRRAVEEALLQTHPYEVPAYEFTSVVTSAGGYGCGAVGNLPSPMSSYEFVELVKATFGSPIVRCSDYPSDGIIRRVALCGGSGAGFLGKALAAKAQAYVTSDTRYHDFVDYGRSILIADIGHHESENCAKSIFYHTITEKFPNFAVRYAEKDTNPIIYS